MDVEMMVSKKEWEMEFDAPELLSVHNPYLPPISSPNTTLYYPHFGTLSFHSRWPFPVPSNVVCDITRTCRFSVLLGDREVRRRIDLVSLPVVTS